MRNILTVMALCSAITLLPVASAHAQPAAIVEDVGGTNLGVEIMDILAKGSVIDLMPGQRLVLGYMNSCVRERIEGGRVVVGVNQSRVTGGRVERETVACHSQGTALAVGTSEGSGLIFRGRDDKYTEMPVLRSRNPVFFAGGAAGPVLIERLDKSEALRRIAMPGPVLEVTDSNMLSPGGKYRVSWGGRTAVFSIHNDPTTAPVPILERLVQLLRE